MGLVACTQPPAGVQEEASKRQSKLIRFFPSDSPGQQNDALILKGTFEKDFPTELIETNGDPDGHDGKTKPSELGATLVNIFIEHVYDLKATKQAKYNWLSINQEFVDPPERLVNIDVVLCKTELGAQLMRAYAQRYNMKFKVYYTKFTTIADSKESSVAKDFELIGHFAGKSPLKNTATVLETWFQNPQFPKLKVTCRAIGDTGGCLREQAQLFFAKHRLPLPPSGESHPAPNIDFYSGFLDTDKLRDWQDRAGIYVTPSAAEGYGHYINEGRARGAVMITTDAPPMNEMVEDGVSGFLVPVKGSAIINPYSMARRYSIDSVELANVVTKVLALPEQEKREIGERGRQSYLNDKRFFEERMKMLAESLKEKGDLSLVPADAFAEPRAKR